MEDISVVYMRCSVTGGTLSSERYECENYEPISELYNDRYYLEGDG
jgi:hypothetical protein